MELLSSDNSKGAAPRIGRSADSMISTCGFLTLLFFASGLSALMLETVWFELLQCVVGATTQSMSILLALYMSGLLIGSSVLPRIVSVSRHPLFIYGTLEIGVSSLALLSLYALARLGDWHSFGRLGDSATIVLEIVICAAFLLPPTVLMGATLPMAARMFRPDRSGMSRVGVFYAANLVGAVTGTVLAGLVLLPIAGLLTTASVAAGVSGTAGLIALLRARKAPYAPAPHGSFLISRGFSKPRTLQLVVALSGAAAMGAQILWTRLLTMLYGASVYAFTIVLAVFLLALGAGSAVGAWAVRIGYPPSTLIGCGQIATACLLPFSIILINDVLPYWAIDVGGTPVERLGTDVIRTLCVVAPSTLVWGATLPLACGAKADSDGEIGVVTGSLIAANTFGAVVGALLIGLVGISQFGLRSAALLAIVVSLIAAFLMLSVVEPRRSCQPNVAIIYSVILATGIAAMLALPRIEPRLVAYGHSMNLWNAGNEIVYASDGAFASVAVSETPDGEDRFFHVGGKVVASNVPKDMRLQLMLGAVPLLAHNDVKSVLVIGAGAGITAGTFIDVPEIERIVICEIEPVVVDAARRHFGEENHHVFDNPKVEVVYDDARHFLAITDERFDVIASDPLHPWLKGAASLYTAETFELARSRLSDRGVLAQWIPLYQTSEAAVKSQIATADSVFEEVSLWRSDPMGTGYDLVLLASTHAVSTPFERIDRRLNSMPEIAAGLRAAGIGSSVDFQSARIGNSDSLQDWLADAQLNSDRNLRLRYLAGKSLHRYEADLIMNSIIDNF